MAHNFCLILGRKYWTRQQRLLFLHVFDCHQGMTWRRMTWQRGAEQQKQQLGRPATPPHQQPRPQRGAPTQQCIDGLHAWSGNHTRKHVRVNCQNVYTCFTRACRLGSRARLRNHSKTVKNSSEPAKFIVEGSPNLSTCFGKPYNGTGPFIVRMHASFK